MIKKFKTIIWDFDGVIIDSDNIRTESFRETFKDFGIDSVDKLINYHKLNGGLSRYHKVNFFFNKILNKNITDDDYKSWVELYGKYCKDRLCDKSLLIEDSINFIRKNYKIFSFHIASASDEKELKFICEKLEISDYFISINGSPTTKVNNVKNILNSYHCIKENCCLIGDSINDREAAKINNIKFFGYNNLDLKVDNSYIDKLNLEK